jgi:hypothetical protein
MKLPEFDTYTTAALILIGLSVVIMGVLFATNRGDFTSATLILIAFSSFLIGLFIFSFHRDDRVDHNVAAALAVPYTTALSRILADVGVSSPAHFIPVPDDGTFPAPVMQFNPVGVKVPENFKKDLTFLTEVEGPGVLTVPSGIPLFNFIKRDQKFTIPLTESDLYNAIHEVLGDLLEIAGDVVVTRSGDAIMMTLKDYKLLLGCFTARNESPLTCLVAPCPVCSLAGIIMALGSKKISYMQQTVIDERSGTLEVYFGLKE